VSDHRVRALDGLRGLAVALVVAAHAVRMGAGGAGEHPDGPAALLLVPFNGGIGVTLFFVLSGFLITGILVREKQRTDHISLSGFYRRRVLRIVPALAVFLAAVGVLGAVGVLSIPGRDLLAASTFTSNYWLPGDTWALGHTWSLSVEEQFYLLWPLVLIALPARRAVQLAVAYCVVAPAVRVASYVLLPDTQGAIWEMFHTRADSLLVGCLLALLPISHPELYARLVHAVRARSTVPVAALVLLASSAAELLLGGRWLFPVGYSTNNVAAAVLVLAALVAAPHTGWMRWRALTFLGLISFSLYLWQQLFLVADPTAPPMFGQFGDWGTAVVGVLAALAVAVLSQRYVEGPFLRLKEGQSRASALAAQNSRR
jgi:peptidoglycan/LPS O-acetylase OafA/YrhL